ncbi:hypothetical protein ES288_D10G167500v1, partial [Gossypium darwinii]
KENQGRRKIKIKIIENENDRLILFSNDCTVIYQKIYEISTLCSGEILFIIFSAIGKPYSFVHPSTKSTAKRFLNANQPLNDTIYAPVEAFRKVRIN